ncbi:MAG: Na+/H+ antiporter subunit E [Pseudomonadota bacterium]
MISLLKRIPAFIVLTVVFIIELIKASIDVALAVISPTENLKPGIVAVPLDLKTDMGIATLANIVSLTPGTTSLHVSDDRKLLYVHVLDHESDESVIKEIKTVLERRVMPIEGTVVPDRLAHKGAST